MCLWVYACVSRSHGSSVRCLAGGVVVNTASLLQCHLSLLSYLLLWQRKGHPIRLRATADWATVCISGEPGTICLDTPALWFRHLLLYVSWQAGWLQCTPADRLCRWKQTEQSMLQIVPSFCSHWLNTTIPVSSWSCCLQILAFKRTRKSFSLTPANQTSWSYSVVFSISAQLMVLGYKAHQWCHHGPNKNMRWQDKHLSKCSIPYLVLGCVYICVKIIQCHIDPNKINSCPLSLLKWT